MQVVKFIFPLVILSIMYCSNKDAVKTDKPTKGTRTSARGEVELSPAQLSKGLVEGISFIPYLSKTKLLTINDILNKTKIKVSLEIAYEYAYDKKLKEAKADGDTGQVFKDMKVANEHFQKLLKRYGLKNYNQYVLTAIDSDSEYMLYATIERKVNFIKVFDKEKGLKVLSLNPDDPKYYEPYEKDTLDNPLDTVVDFGAVLKKDAFTQKTQSILLTMAANSVLEKKKSLGYWSIEKRWIKGDTQAVLEESEASIDKRIGIE